MLSVHHPNNQLANGQNGGEVPSSRAGTGAAAGSGSGSGSGGNASTLTSQMSSSIATSSLRLSTAGYDGGIDNGATIVSDANNSKSNADIYPISVNSVMVTSPGQGSSSNTNANAPPRLPTSEIFAWVLLCYNQCCHTTLSDLL
jgi:hypothetical protein